MKPGILGRAPLRESVPIVITAPPTNRGVRRAAQRASLGGPAGIAMTAPAVSGRAVEVA